MESSERISRIIALIADDQSLKAFVKGIPEAILMPFANERHKHYVVVTLVISEESLGRSTLATICRRVVELLRSNDLLSEMDGLEVTLGAPQAGRMRRVLRLGVLSEAIPRAELLVPDDIDLPNPANGITCTKYRAVPA